jgi:hypothetical protein
VLSAGLIVPASSSIGGVITAKLAVRGMGLSGLEKQTRHPHGHSYTKHEDGDGGHRETEEQVLGSEMLSNTPIVTSY